MVLELPENITDQVGSGSLVIELEGDIREKEGWQEQLKYVKGNMQGYTWSEFGHAYKLHGETKTWTEAEAECQKEGGHLASVASEEVNEELHRLAGDIVYGVWLGGKQESGVLSWSDNSTWGYTNWYRDPGSRGDEYDYHVYLDGSDGTWLTTTSSKSRTAFICQLASPSLRGKEKLDINYILGRQHIQS